MKKSSKDDVDILGAINKIQDQLTALDLKLSAFMNRSLSEPKPSPKPPENKPNDRNTSRVLYTAICADCKKECSIPFKPSGDRPVYCKDCFSRRRVISLSGMTVTNKPSEAPPPVEVKKKTVTVKKVVKKKKPAPKKK